MLAVTLNYMFAPGPDIITIHNLDHLRFMLLYVHIIKTDCHDELFDDRRIESPSFNLNKKDKGKGPKTTDANLLCYILVFFSEFLGGILD